MRIDFYNMNSERNVINKHKTFVSSITCDSNLYEMDLFSPILHLEDFDTISPNVNYCVINSVFCYFIESLSHTVSGLCKLSLELDTLETYKNDILNSYAECVESDSANPFYENSDYKANITNTIKKIEFPYTFDDLGQLMLLVVN